MTKKLKTISIKGNPYVTVSERILGFHDLYKDGSIETEILFVDETTVRVKATVKIPVEDTKTTEVHVTGFRTFNGHAEENRNDGNVNRTSAVENAETSAVGRALGMLGIGILDGVASADEVHIAQGKETRNELPGHKDCASCGAEFDVYGNEGTWKTTCKKCYAEGKKPKEEKGVPSIDENGNPLDADGQPF